MGDEDEFVTENERIEKIRGNLKLINQIMSISREDDFATSSSQVNCYLPLPNHNYN